MWFIYWDPCGLVCYIFGWFVVLLANYVTIFEVLRPWFGFSTKNLTGFFHGAVFQVIIVLILWSYTRAGFTDPGSVKCGTASPEDAYPPADDPDRPFKPKRRFCPKCNCIKPPRAHHCSTCGRCVQKMDHHCPWVNNCVGSNNMKHFLLFLFWVFVGATYCFALCVSRFLYCWSDTRRCPNPTVTSVIVTSAGAILSLFFAIFVIAMACDQYEGLVTNTTAIESMKAWKEEERSVFQGLRDVMGEPFSWRWFVPLPLRPDSPSYYEWRETDDPDAYDPRDPLIRRHFRKLEEAMAKGWQPDQRQPPPRRGEGADVANEAAAGTPQPEGDACGLTAASRAPHAAPEYEPRPAGGDGLRQTTQGKKQKAAAAAAGK